MKKLIATMQKREVSREVMVNKLEEILIPLAEILNDNTPVYQGFPLKSISIKGDEEAFMISFNGQTLALVNLKHSQFSVFYSPNYDLTAEEHAVISHLWSELQKARANNAIENLMKLLASKYVNN